MDMSELPGLQTSLDAQLLHPISYWAAGGVVVQWNPEVVYLHANLPFECVGSSIYGGGFRSLQHIANFKVDKNYNCLDPKTDVENRLTGLGIDRRELQMAAGFLTAAQVSDAGWTVRTGQSWALLASVSVGTANGARVPKEFGWMSHSNHTRSTKGWTPGTINTLILVAGRVSHQALVGGIITATEAKSSALADLKVEVDEGVYATGTSTDAIVIGATQHLPFDLPAATETPAPLSDSSSVDWIEYAGLATEFGAALGGAVYESVIRAGKRYLHRQKR